MSVSLGLYKGKQFDCSTSRFIAAIPVSFQEVWNSTWTKAIDECNIQSFVICKDFTVNDIPIVLKELDAIYVWTYDKGGKDAKYVQERIKELKNYLDQFYSEHKDEDYWFDLG